MQINIFNQLNMKKVKKWNNYKTMAIIGMILWLTESWYFGWNIEAVTSAEKYMDTFFSVLVLWGVFGDLSSNMCIIKLNQ